VNTLTQFDSLKNAGALMTAYQDGITQQEAAAEIVFGVIPATGKLPVSLNTNYKQGMGLTTTSLARLQYNVLPEAVGISSEFLNSKVDSMAKLAIAVKGAPGVVVLIAKEGKRPWVSRRDHEEQSKTIGYADTQVPSIPRANCCGTSRPYLAC
jgi:hypothetical protein